MKALRLLPVDNCIALLNYHHYYEELGHILKENNQFDEAAKRFAASDLFVEAAECYTLGKQEIEAAKCCIKLTIALENSTRLQCNRVEFSNAMVSLMLTCSYIEHYRSLLSKSYDQEFRREKLFEQAKESLKNAYSVLIKIYTQHNKVKQGKR